ncbi:MAG TPA: hypothetical protein PK765_06225 [bacterium]|nr:hypothetical protein [bacterium]
MHSKLSVLLLALPALTLSSCLGSSTESADTVVRAGTGYSVSVPSAWTEVPAKNLPTIPRGTIELAMNSREISGGFANNLTILSESLDRDTTSREYAITNNTLSTAEYIEYQKLSETEIAFVDEDTSLLYEFEARYNTTTPKIRFFQTAKICGQKAYLITVGVSLDTEGSTRYEELVKSFECREEK